MIHLFARFGVATKKKIRLQSIAETNESRLVKGNK